MVASSTDEYNQSKKSCGIGAGGLSLGQLIRILAAAGHHRSAYFWWRQFRWGIALAVLPDLDWVSSNGQEIFHFQIPFYRQPHLHHLLQFILQWPPVTYLDGCPTTDITPELPVELLLMAVLLVAGRFLTGRAVRRRSS